MSKKGGRGLKPFGSMTLLQNASLIIFYCLFRCLAVLIKRLFVQNNFFSWLDFLGVVQIWVFNFKITSVFEFCQYLTLWFVKYLEFCKIAMSSVFRFCYNLNFEFCHNLSFNLHHILSFKVMSQLGLFLALSHIEFLSFISTQ